MTHELVSRRLRTMLVDYLSGSSVLRQITDEFDAADIPYRPIEGQSSAGSGALWLTNITMVWNLLLQGTRANS